MSIHSLGFVGFESPDPSAWSGFATDVLGMSLASPLPDGTVRVRLDDYHHRIAIHPGDRARLAYIGWEVTDRRDLDDISKRLDTAGIEVEQASPEQCRQRTVQDMVRFADPAGFVHEMCFGASYRLRSFHPSRHHAGFVAGDRGLGHIVLLVSDLAPQLWLFEDVLGFRLTEGGPPRPGSRFAAAFLRCNPRHHSIAFVQYPGVRGVHHVYIECNEITDVGIALDLAEEHGHPITMSLGQHLGDDAISFYVRTPGGFDLEYGCGSLSVDDRFPGGRGSFGPGEMWGHRRLSDTLPETIDVDDDAALDLVRKVLLRPG